MKKTIAIMMVVSFAVLILGCETNKTRVAEGAVAGGALGALAGGLIGHGQGAGIGAAIGATGGALIGSQIEKKPAQQASGTPSQMSVMDVVQLAKQGAPDDVIIDEIRRSNSKFTLSAETIDYLKKQGVSNKVIDVMMGR